jgi:hypothetical protein
MRNLLNISPLQGGENAKLLGLRKNEEGENHREVEELGA